MARTLGDRFVNLAMRPVSFAGACLRSGDVDRGLAELAAESLFGGVKRAAESIAADAGVPPSLVEGVLPMEEMDKLLAKIEGTQVAAAAQWALHIGHGSSLLEAIAKLTADARPAEAALSLNRIATKMKLEKALAIPLRELAGQIEEWCELLAMTRRRLDDGKHLEAARRRRRQRRMVVTFAIVAVVFSAAGVVTRVIQARARIEARVLGDEPCDVELIDPSDLARASSEQNVAVATRREQCAGARERARIEEQKERAAAAKAKREEAERLEREAACKRLGEALAHTKPGADLEPAMAKVAGKSADLLGRLVKGQLALEDLTVDLAALPCMNSPAADAIAQAYAAAAVASSAQWLATHAPSPSALALLSRGKAGVSEDERLRIAREVEKLAEKALMWGNPEELERTRKLCALLTRLGLEPSLHCQASEKVPPH